MRVDDIDSIADYWLNSDPVFLKAMGVDLTKLPVREDFQKMLQIQIQLPVEQKRSYGIIWESDGVAVGHCNTNPTTYGEEAFLHLHLWDSPLRKKGHGSAFIAMTIPVFFEKLKLKKIISEPYALNAAPNSTLSKAGFTFIKEYITIPGSLNFEQPVKRWELTYEEFIKKNA